MKRHRHWSLVGLVLVAAAAGCGGVGTTEVGIATQQVTAPGWMAELDLPGCSDLGALDAPDVRRYPPSWRVLGHPLHSDLAIATAVDVPLCVDTCAGVLEAARRLNAEVWIPTDPTALGPTAAAPWPGDDPIPLGKGEGSEGVRSEGTGAEQQGGVEDDPIPLGKNGGSEQGSGENEDEPIPLAKVSYPPYSSVVPHGNNPIALVDGRRLTPVAPSGTTPP